jgi:hypothetical protein
MSGFLRAALLVLILVGGWVAVIALGDSVNVHDQKVFAVGVVVGLAVAYLIVPVVRWANRYRE